MFYIKQAIFVQGISFIFQITKKANSWEKTPSSHFLAEEEYIYEYENEGNKQTQSKELCLK